MREQGQYAEFFRDVDILQPKPLIDSLGSEISKDNFQSSNTTKKELSAILDDPTRVFWALQEKIAIWATEKDLIPGNPEKQTIKLMEESGELASAILKNDKIKIIDGIGDCLVVLIILARQLNVLPETCLLHAWNEIKNRTGKNVNGTFIKDLR